LIAARLQAVRERIATACDRVSRDPAGIRLIGVSKTQPASAVREAFAAGLRDFGENRVQEAEAKAEELADLRAAGLRFHLIGHLQANKAKKAAALFDAVHSVDEGALATRLARAAEDEGRVLSVLVQVDLAGEQTKFGLAENHLLSTLEGMRGLTGLRVEGLMVLPPYADDPEQARPYFRQLRDLRDRASAFGLLAAGELSMGMSHDFEVAIEEGATMVRVGTALFGARG
jgi:pyridoxal phosphate enzyme (YggS family)